MRWSILALITIGFVLLMVVAICAADAPDWEESANINTIFNSSGIKGTFVLYDVTARKHIGYDRIRAEKRFVPASTFKIPNTIIGLSVGAVKSVDEIIPYRGNPNPFIKAWAKDMGLREAIVVSNVPIYQELARRIGLERMRAGLERLNYGNKETGTIIEQ